MGWPERPGWMMSRSRMVSFQVSRSLLLADRAQLCQDILRGGHVGVFLCHVKEVHLVHGCRSVVYRIVGNDHVEVI